MVDALEADQHKEAVKLLGRLVENKPENVVYRESYGNELYRLGIQHYDSLQTMSAEDSLKLHQTKASADTLLALAEEQFITVMNERSGATDLKEQLANLHQNYAAHMSQVQSMFSDSVRNEIGDKIESNLKESVNLFEELVRENPDRSEYWKNLYQAYSYLGMQEEASEAKAKANL